ncbi:MAG: GIY-YIG nuclease family protein [Candidatus Doudnabacteria bacterium]|nr:GIY-YIG nuclease family protein [Candidatus Doudnabacteria bacterium]
MFYCYMLRCANGSLYTGSTDNLERRERLHNQGKGSAYVRSRGGGVIVYAEVYPTRSAALRREVVVKRMTKAAKEKLILEKAKK